MPLDTLTPEQALIGRAEALIAVAPYYEPTLKVALTNLKWGMRSPIANLKIQRTALSNVLDTIAFDLINQAKIIVALDPKSEYVIHPDFTLFSTTLNLHSLNLKTALESNNQKEIQDNTHKLLKSLGELLIYVKSPSEPKTRAKP